MKMRQAAIWGILASIPAATALAAQRPVTVPDMIEMTDFDGNNAYQEGLVRPAVFSADGSRFAVVVSKGNLQDNTNIYSILLFSTADPKRSPQTVATFASSTSRPGIANVHWTAQDSALMFLGERAGETPQVYRLDLKTLQIEAVTQSATPVVSFNLSADSSRLFYAAEKAPDAAVMEDMAARGFVVNHGVRDILAGRWQLREGEESPQEMFSVSMTGSASARKQIRIEPTRVSDCADPLMSPNGRFAVARCYISPPPAHWREYLDGMRGWAVFSVMGLIDLEQGTAEPLIDVPWHRTEIEWSPDSSAVLARKTLLPLEGVEPPERKLRGNLKATAMIDPLTRAVSILAREDTWTVDRWSVDGRQIVLKDEKDAKKRIAFAKQGSQWVALAAQKVPLDPASKNKRIDVVIDQGLNTPPRLAVLDAKGRKTVFYDPNPQFTGLQFAREDIIKWQTRDGEWIAGLYYPLNYEKGRRYPLVIQTHGFSRDRFQISGYARTGYAAQALAGAGIMVIQMAIEPQPAFRNALSTKEELPTDRRAIEGLIDHLSGEGLIDKNKVGLQGWSRTTYGARYMMSHSDYPLAAVLISDGVDFSYFRYLVDNDNFRNTAEGINGGIPLGDDFKTWQERVPTLNAQRMNTPLRIEAIQWGGGGGPLTQWELYTLLRRLNKPVEMIYYPRGQHNLVLPWERLSSQGGAYDWFRYWLQGAVDPAEQKKAQYARWEQMKSQKNR